MENVFSGYRTDSVNPTAELNSGLEGPRARIEKLHELSVSLNIPLPLQTHFHTGLSVYGEGFLTSHFPPCALQIQLLEDSECQSTSSSSPNISIVLEKILWLAQLRSHAHSGSSPEVRSLCFLSEWMKWSPSNRMSDSSYSNHLRLSFQHLFISMVIYRDCEIANCH